MVVALKGKRRLYDSRETFADTASKIRAQRKFAQGVVVHNEEFVEHKKEKKKRKKKVADPHALSPSPTSSPVKRPKTEDFLSFLCYRGTPALPPALDFFNFVPANTRSSKIDSASTSAKPSSSTLKSAPKPKSKDNPPLTKEKEKASSSTTPSKDKDSSKAAVFKLAKKKTEPNDSSEKPLKVPLAVLASPKSTRINEQDAQFAMTALKLKYQEKRLSKLQASSNIVSKLTKKVKDRVILTRSKAKDSDRRSPQTQKVSRIIRSPDRKLRLHKKQIKPLRKHSEERNAPSPDIIYGVRPKNRSEKMKPPPSNSSSSDNESTRQKSPTPEKKITKSIVRTLRGGREYVFEAKKIIKIKPKLPSKRISTRASRRDAASPLRELPMYGTPKKKKMATKAKTRLKKATKKESGSRRDSFDSESSIRPTRRTKENAAIYLGLLNKDFSSDDNGSDEDRPQGDEDDSSGNSSSSETKFLENQYRACLKRESNKIDVKPKDKQKEKRLKLKKKALEELRKKSKGKQIKKKIPAKRMLRSQSGKDSTRRNESDCSEEAAARVTRRRATIPLTPSERTLAGAARKSASQVPRRNTHRTESSSSTSSTESEPDEKLEIIKNRKIPLARKKGKAVTTKPERSSSSDTTGESGSDAEEEEQIPKKVAKATKPASAAKKTKLKVTSASESESDMEDKDDKEVEGGLQRNDSSESEEEIPVQKTSIAIQVDMDSEETPELNDLYQNAADEVIEVGAFPRQIPDFMAGLTNDHPTPATTTTPLILPTFNMPSYFPPLSTPLGSRAGMISQQNDFSLVFPNLNIPGISNNLPMASFAGQLSAYSSILSAQGPLCFSSASSNSIATATTLQTHIRSVAANLDIPLVRPVVASGANSMLTLPLPGSRFHNIPLTRPSLTPLNWADPRSTSQSHAGMQAHFSAFRTPFSSVPTPAASRIYTPLATTRASAGQGTSRGQSTSSSTQSRSQHSSTGFRNMQPLASGSSPGQAGVRPLVPSHSSHGLSLIQSLPNVSIVPRFDRSSKHLTIQPDKIGLSSSKSGSSSTSKPAKKPNAEVEKREPKKVGRKRKSIVPVPTSPLTVRKDSSTPATYIGLSSKKQHKEKEKVATPSTSMGTTTSKKPTNGNGESFNKLLQAKTSDTLSDASPPTSPCPSNTDSIEREKIKEQEKREQIPDVPAFYPTDEEFQDPLKYIERIQGDYECIGMARIVPPRSFRPECNVEDDMRFTAYNHYIHRMHKRWGPNVHERMAILEHLRKSKIDVSVAPVIGGMEVDLATLYHTVQSFGGLEEVIEKHKWNKVSDAMHIPKAANDRATKLDGIYVKYVLSYEMLSENERKKLLAQVEEKWRCRENKNENDDNSDSESDEEDPFEEVEDCIIKGKSTPLSSYYRVARNTLSMIFRNREPTISEVETNYWRQVQDKTRHLCVYSGSIDCAGAGWGFPLPNATTKHPWNLKVLANNPASVLRSMGPVMAQLHVGMVFTTYCWYRDPQGLPWLEYQHSGGNKIWYVVPGSQETLFREVLTELMPAQCRNKKIWLPSDSVMVPLESLTSRGISLYRAVQNPGEFLVVSPKAFTSAICTGYVISESVSFAFPKWLNTARQTFEDIRESKEPPVFALEKLLICIVEDTKVASDVLKKALNIAGPLLKEELSWRKKLCDMGVSTGKMDKTVEKPSKLSKRKAEEEVYECNNCNYILHLSTVVNKGRGFVYCLPHAVQHLSKTKSHIKSSRLLIDSSEEHLMSLLEAARSRLK